MKLIIDISEYDREWIKNTYGIPQDIDVAIARAIINGKELPDHHGRLVDADADILKNKLKFINEAEHQIYGRGSWGFTAKCIHAIDDAPTVIEAEDGQ